MIVKKYQNITKVSQKVKLTFLQGKNKKEEDIVMLV